MTKTLPLRAYSVMNNCLRVALIGCLMQFSFASSAQTINTKMPQTNGSVNAIAQKGDSVFIGGTFTKVGVIGQYGVPLDANGKLPSGFPQPNGTVSTVISDKAGGWYIGGTFTMVGNVARTNLAHITSKGTVDPLFAGYAFNNPVLSLQLAGNKLYVGGSFTTLSTNTGKAVLVNAGTGAMITAFPNVNGVVNVITADGNGGWYIGGTFTQVGNVKRRNIAHVNADGTVHDWNPSANNTVLAILVSDNTIYIGGTFTGVGSLTRNRIAAVDAATGIATAWNPNATTGQVSAIAKRGDTVVVGGTFTAIAATTRSRLAALNAKTGVLTAFNPAPNSTVNALAFSNDTLYVGGLFTTISGVTTKPRLASYKITTAGAGPITTFAPVPNNTVTVLTIANKVLYVGGTFTSISSTTRTGAAAYTLNGTTPALTAWNPNPSTNNVTGISATNQAVYLTGSFTFVSGTAKRFAAAVNLTTGALLSGFNPDPNAVLNAVSASSDKVLFGGTITGVGSTVRNRVACLDASSGVVTSWNPNANNTVNTLLLSGSVVYAGGSFTSIGGTAKNYIAALDASSGATVTSFATIVNSSVTSLALSGPMLYVGGSFTGSGGISRAYLAGVDAATGTVSSSFAPNINSTVSALCVTGGVLYAGGSFTSAGGSPRSYAAAFNISTGTLTSWNPQPNSTVTSLTAGNGVVYMGGNFTLLKSVPRNRIAAVDLNTGAPNNWDPAANGTVSSMAFYNGILYAGGPFSRIGGETRNRLAAFNAVTGEIYPWNPNLNSTVSAIAVASDKIYAGGSFSTVGGVTRRYLASFDLQSGSMNNWNPSPNSVVNTIAVVANKIFVGGGFSAIGGQGRSYLAALDENGFATSFNPAANNYVYKLLIEGDSLYVGGAFSYLNGSTRNRLGVYTLSTLSLTSINPVINNVVNDLAKKGDTLFLSGSFTSVGGSARLRIASYKLSTKTVTSWYPAGGAGSTVNSISVSGNTIFAGGAFTSFGGSSRNYLAAADVNTGVVNTWDGNANTTVQRLYANATDVFIGGSFSTIKAETYPNFVDLTTCTSAVTPDVSFVSPACVNGTMQLKASTVANANYYWTGPNGFTSSLQNPIVENATAASEGVYSAYVVVGGCKSGISAVDVDVTGSTVSASNSSPCVGENLELFATSSAGATYTWTGPNGFTSTLQNPVINTVTETAAGTYTVTATNAGCASQSASTVVTLKATKPVISPESPISTCGNNPVSLDAGSGYISYEWSTGATTRTIDVTESGTYTVRVTTANGCVSEDQSVNVTVSTPVNITYATGDQTVCAGKPVTMSVTATGATSYQWYFNDQPLDNDENISGAATAVLTIRQTDVSNQGSYYCIAGSNSVCGSVTSAATTLTVNPVVTITAQPQLSYPVCTGSNVSLAVSTSSSAVTYQWFKDGVALNNDAHYSGTTTATLIISNATAADESDHYYCEITDPNSNCTDKLTTIHSKVLMNEAPALLSSLPNLTLCTGQTIDISALSKGEELSYQWRRNGVNLTDGSVVTGVNQETLTFSGVTLTEAAGYDVVITNACGTVTSAGFTVNVNTSPVVSAGTDRTICNESTTTLSATGATTYVWNPINANTANVVVSPSFTTEYTVIGTTNGCSSSDVVTVTVLDKPDAPEVSGQTSICSGQTAILTANGDDNATYQWYNASNTLVATTQGFTTPSLFANTNYSVQQTVNTCASNRSAVSVTVNALPVATISASGPTTFCAGGSVTLTAIASDSYLWSNGATTQSIVVTQSGSYSVTVTNENDCSTTSTAVGVTVNAIPTAVITAGGPTTFCAGGSVVLTATAGSSYLWSNGAASQSITVTQSGSYSVRVTNSNGCSNTSAPVSVTVNALPVAVVTANGPTTFCAGGSVILTAASANSYVWSNGATTQSITVTQSGSYGVTVSNGSCSATSTAVAVTVNSLPTASVTAGGPTTFCAGGSVTLTANAGASYAWSNGETTQSITVTQSGSYGVTVSNGNCSATSSSVAVTVNALPVAAITANGPTTFCAGGSVTLTAANANSYAWSNGATTQSITVSQAGSYSVTVSNGNCSAISSAFAVTVNALPTASITAGGSTTFCSGGSVNLSASGGVSFVWSDGTTNQNFNATTSANYSVTVTDAAGCSATSSAVNVTVKATPVAPTYSGVTAVCKGGSTTITVQHADPSATFAWCNNASSGNTLNLSNVQFNTTFCVSARVNGCSSVQIPIPVTVLTVPSATVSKTDVSCVNTNDGSITINASGASSYSIDGTNFSTNNVFSNLAAGTYNVAAKSSAGCISASQNIIIITAPDITKPVFMSTGSSAPATILNNVPEAQGYRLVYELNIPNTALWNSNSVIPYATNNAASLAGAPFGRIAYYMQLDSKWVWVSMDKFTSDLKLIGIPGATPWQQRVNNMNVLSSANANVTNGTGIITGNIEFWTNCYSTRATLGLPNANSSTYDYDDVMDGVNCYGSFQVHNYGARQTLFAYNRWANGNGNSDLGIGNNTGNAHPDYTFQQNAGSYSVKKLYVLVDGGLADITATTDVNSCTATVNVPVPAATDNCSVPVVTGVRADGLALNAGYPVGTTAITWTAVDAAGNTAVATQNVIVKDIILPSIAAPSDISVAANATTNCKATVSLGTPTTSDNCGVRSVTNDAPATFNPGTTIVTWTVTDNNNNVNTAKQNVTVTIPAVIVSGNGNNISNNATTVNSADNTDFGTALPNQILSKTFSIKNSGNAPLVISSIGLSGTNASLFNVNGIELPFTVNAGERADFNVSFSSPSVVSAAATVTINTDACTNANYSFAVKAEVTCVQPAFTNNNNYIQAFTNTASCDAAVTYILAATGTPAPSVSYLFTGVTTGEGQGTGSGAVFNKGVTHVTVNAANACGTAAVNFDVTVLDNVKPVAKAKNITLKLSATGTASFKAEDINDNSYDNCGNVTVSVKPTGRICGAAVEGSSLTLTAPPGALITSIDFASYGTPGGSCGVWTLGTCHAANSKAIVEQLALGKNTVTISANNNVFGDPCYGTGKRLYVQATYTMSNAVNTPITYTCNNVGENKAVLVVTDADGNGSAADAIITVVDDIAPTVRTQNVSVTLNVQGFAIVNATQIDNGSSDGCAPVTLTLSQTRFDCSNVGNNRVILTATDRNGNSATAEATVTVTDNIKPTITAPSVVRVNTDANLCSASNVALGSPLVYDICGIASVTNNAPTTFPVGTTTVIWTVTDKNGNSATTTQSVIVDDIQKPVVVAGADISVDNEKGKCGATVEISEPSVNDNCGIATVRASKTGFFPVGTTTITWTVTDIHGNVNTATQNIIVNDIEAPIITAPSNVAVNNDAGKCSASNVTLGTPQTSDNCGVASVTNDAPAIFPVGTSTVTWTVTDVHGNKATAVQTVTVTDNEKPTVIPSADITVNNDRGICGAAINLVKPEVKDNCGVASVEVSQSEFFPVGTTIITWTVTDIHGNVNTATQKITVSDNEAPIITAPSNVAVNNDAGKCSASNVILGTPKTSDNCGIASVTNNAPAVFPVGTTTVTWTVTDIHENTATAVQTVTVTDNEKPVVIPAANITVNNDRGGCGATISLTKPEVKDNCGVASVEVSQSEFFPVGTTIITWTVTDIHGNVNTATQKITVTDNEAPIITAPNNITVNNDAGKCSASNIALGTPNTSDNCGIASVTNNAPVVFPVGTTIVTWTVTDIHGNANTTTQKITVNDNEAPVVTAPANQLYCYNGGSAYALEAVKATDNCGVNNYSYTLNNDATVYAGSNASRLFPVGVTVIHWTVSDIHGNKTTATTTVTVNAPISVSIPEVYAVSPGGNVNTLYIGYGPASVTITATPAGGTAPYTYKWSNGSVAQTLNVSSAGTYTVTITDSKGCTATVSKTINAIDVRCGNNNDKVIVCQVPPGNTGNLQTICIAPSAVASHLAKGSYLGNCRVPTTAARTSDVTNIISVAKEDMLMYDGKITLVITPNPTTGVFIARLYNAAKGRARVEVVAMNGTMVEIKNAEVSQSLTNIGFDLSAKAQGMYKIRATDAQGKSTVTTIMIQR